MITSDNLETKYIEAVYVVIADNAEIRFSIGKFSIHIARLLSQHKAETFAFITAHNPHSRRLSDEENESRQLNLINLLKAENYKFLKGYGTDENETWQCEESVFILNADRTRASQIARHFNQNAFVFGTTNTAPELVWTGK